MSEFISFISSEAASHCADGSRRNLDGEDIVWALTSLGFEHYIDTLQVVKCQVAIFLAQLLTRVHPDFSAQLESRECGKQLFLSG